MANNTLIGLGIIGILSTGSVAVVANTQSLIGQDSSALLDASNVLLEQDSPQTPGVGITAPTLESPTPVGESLPAESATPEDAQVATPAPVVTPPPAPVVAPAVPTPAPVDATSSGSAYSDDDDDYDRDDDDDDYEEDDDDSDDDHDDDDHEDDDD
jgi:hypothetical protein